MIWQCNNKRQGRAESLDRPSELLRISSKFHEKKIRHTYIWLSVSSSSSSSSLSLLSLLLSFFLLRTRVFFTRRLAVCYPFIFWLRASHCYQITVKPFFFFRFHFFKPLILSLLNINPFSFRAVAVCRVSGHKIRTILLRNKLYFINIRSRPSNS